MPLTPEESQSILSELESGKSIAEIELLKPLGDVVVRTKKQEETFRSNFENDLISAKTKEIHGQYDNDIESITGLKKNPDTKTYDHLKSILTDFKGKVDGAQNEINTLKDQIKTDGSDVLRNELESWKSKYTTDVSQKDSMIEEMQKKHLNLSKQRFVDSSFGEISKNFIESLPGYFASHKDAVLKDIVQNSRLSEDGKKLVLLKPDGSVLKDANFNEMNLDVYMAEQFKEVVKQGAGSGGAGGGTPPNPNNGTPPEPTNEWEKIEMPDTIKTQIELREWIYDTHGAMDRKDVNKAFNSLIVKHKLPLQ